METVENRHFGDPVTMGTIVASGLASPWFGFSRVYLDQKPCYSDDFYDNTLNLCKKIISKKSIATIIAYRKYKLLQCEERKIINC
jgi:hypothetical protein